MGLKRARDLIVKCLKSGEFVNEDRLNQAEKNLLATRQVTEQDVIKMVCSCTGNQYEERDHETVPGVKVHIMKPNGWYIKFYYSEPNCIVISVHR